MDAADMLTLAATVGAAIFVFVLLTLGAHHDIGRRRRRRASTADFEGALESVHSGAGRKVGSSSRRAPPRPGSTPKRSGRSSDAGVFPVYMFAGDGGGGSHCSSDGGGGGGACDGGGGS